jgi:peptidoglycan/xylan/chitin deacetylase (PgdA/CDA1 family)
MLHRFAIRDGSAPRGHDGVFVADAIAYLRATDFTILSIDEIVGGLLAENLPRRVVGFTIDDGYADQGQFGAEIFLAQDCPVTIYLVTRLVDGTDWPVDAKASYLFRRAQGPFTMVLRGREVTASPSDLSAYDRIRHKFVFELKEFSLEEAEARIALLAGQLEIELPREPPPGYRGLSWDQVRSLEKRGISFGAHTARHVTLSTESGAVVRQELEESTRRVREHLECPSGVFCYPTGRFRDYGEREVAILKELGYRAAVTAEPGYASIGTGEDSRFHLLRFGMPDNMLDFKDIVLQLQRLRDRGAGRRRR